MIANKVPRIKRLLSEEYNGKTAEACPRKATKCLQFPSNSALAACTPSDAAANSNLIIDNWEVVILR